MASQGERQNYVWRPNDNSSTIRLRYDLEAEHWVRAVNSAQEKAKPMNVGAAFGTIGLVIQLIYNIIWLLVYGIKSLITLMVGTPPPKP